MSSPDWRAIFGLARTPVTLEEMPNRRPQLKIVAPSASPEEAAALVAALEQFMRATAPTLAATAEPGDPWTRAALLEGVSREPVPGSPWGDPQPWG
jgi:hypothetical protein